MKRLSKDQAKRREKIINDLRNEAENVQTAIAEFNAKKDAAYAAVGAAIESYNAVVEEAESLREEVASDQESYYDERSDNWRDGDAGQQYDQWKSNWSETLDPLEVDEPEPLEPPDMEHADKIESEMQESADEA